MYYFLSQMTANLYNLGHMWAHPTKLGATLLLSWCFGNSAYTVTASCACGCFQTSWRNKNHELRLDSFFLWNEKPAIVFVPNTFSSKLSSGFVSYTFPLKILRSKQALKLLKWITCWLNLVWSVASGGQLHCTPSRLWMKLTHQWYLFPAPKTKLSSFL